MHCDVTTLLEQTLQDFCRSFLANPYLCYTEHGLHALFYAQLFNALPPEQQFFELGGQKVCVLQKEYPTAGKLGKSKCQHWDIAVIKNPPTSVREAPQPYDRLHLAAVIEFGMNATLEHLEDDVRRLLHPDANLELGTAVHLYRLTAPGDKRSRRDLSYNDDDVSTIAQVAELVGKQSTTIYYGIYDAGNKYQTGLWRIRDGMVRDIRYDGLATAKEPVIN